MRKTNDSSSRLGRRFALRTLGVAALAFTALTASRALAEINLNLYGSVPMTEAAAKGDAKTVHNLLLNGGSPNDVDPTGRPAIVWAALANSVDVVEELIKARVVCDAKDKEGNTALQMAAARGYNEVVATLIAAKANLNLDNREGMTALTLAARNGQLRTVQMLLKAGADASIQDRTGRTALDWATENNKSQVVEYMKRAGVKS